MKVPLAAKIALWIFIPGGLLLAAYAGYKYFKNKQAQGSGINPYTGPKTGPDGSIGQGPQL